MMTWRGISVRDHFSREAATCLKSNEYAGVILVRCEQTVRVLARSRVRVQCKS